MSNDDRKSRWSIHFNSSRMTHSIFQDEYVPYWSCFKWIALTWMRVWKCWFPLTVHWLFILNVMDWSSIDWLRFPDCSFSFHVLKERPEFHQLVYSKVRLSIHQYHEHRNNTSMDNDDDDHQRHVLNYLEWTQILRIFHHENRCIYISVFFAILISRRNLQSHTVHLLIKVDVTLI